MKKHYCENCKYRIPVVELIAGLPYFHLPAPSGYYCKLTKKEEFIGNEEKYETEIRYKRGKVKNRNFKCRDYVESCVPKIKCFLGLEKAVVIRVSPFPKED